MRSSYGTFGVTYEVTYRIRPLLPMGVYHETYTLDEFITQLDALKARDESSVLVSFPFDDKITIEFRRYNPGATGIPNRAAWICATHPVGHGRPALWTRHRGDRPRSYASLRGDRQFRRDPAFQARTPGPRGYTLPPDQIVEYPPVSDDRRYTFSLFAFPEAKFPEVFSEFIAFVRDYHDRVGYRSNLAYVGYRIAQDQHALLSYS